MAPLAYGALELTPWQFGRLTPGELAQLAEGYKWRSEEKQRAAACLIAPIINTCASHELKRPVTVEMLTGIREQKRQNAGRTREQAEKEIAGLLAEVG